MNTILKIIALAAAACACGARADNWPEYRHDSQRSARTAETLAPPLHLQWVHTPAQPPAPAWPPPAKWDYLHNHGFVQGPSELYDRAFEVVVADGRLYFGSSTDDGLHCLDAATGKELWAFHTEAPLRMAPAVADGKVIASGDDGCVYAVDAESGKLLWKTRPTPTDLRIAGNGRIISLWPNRTGVTIAGGTATVVLGLFPLQKIYVARLNLADGSIVSTNLTDKPMQGYARIENDQLVAPQGRVAKWVSAAGAFTPGKEAAFAAAAPLAKECPFVQVAAGTLQVGGGDGKIVAFDVPATGGVPQRVWEAAVEGEARSLAISGGRLFVSTSAGKIYAFSAAKAAAVRTAVPRTKLAVPAAAEKTGRTLAELAAKNGIRKGYALVADRTGSLAAPLARAGLDVVVVLPDADAALKLRQAFAAAGLGGRVSVHPVPAGGKLPHATWLFDLVAHEGLIAGEPPDAGLADELRRVLRPYGGLGFLGPKPELTVTTGPLEGAGEWSHFYANLENNACSGDTRITDALRLQWFGEPGPEHMVDRHNRGVAPVCKDGRLFVCGNDYLYGVNAFNGKILWEKALANSVRPDATKESANMSVMDDTLYVAAGPDCLALDAAGGETRRVFKGKAGSEWGYVAATDGLLVGSRCGPGAHRREFSQSSWTNTYSPLVPVVCSFDVFAFDAKSGKRRWTYTPDKGVVVNTTLLIAGSKLFFIESLNPATKAVASSRVLLPPLVTNGTDLVALDLKDGQPLLRKAVDLSRVQHMLFMAHSRGVLLVTGVYTDAGIVHQLTAIKAEDGSRLWRRDHTAPGTDQSGQHGELSFRPALVGDTIVAPPVQLELGTGNPVDGWKWERGGHGCGAISTCATHVFNRGTNPFMRNLKTGQGGRITAETRPGCWINIIPACGLVLIPEASSGCQCAYPVQASLGFVPAPPAP